MKKVIFLFLISFVATNLIAQTNDINSISQTIQSNAPIQRTREKVENFLYSHYPFIGIVDTLGVIYDYNFNEALTSFVVEHIHNFYNLVQDGVSQHQITSKMQIQTMYLNFIDSTKAILSNTTFPKNPSSTPLVKQLNGPCVNMDFEDGSTNGWSLYDGQVDGSAAYSYTNNTSVGPGASHLITTAGSDPVCGIPMVDPSGGSYSCRLGDGTGTNYGAARMTQSFLVSASNSIFSYSYAVVLNDPGHPASQQPYFTLRVYDEFNNNVSCGAYSVYANSSSTSDFITTSYNGETVLYKNWTTVFLN